MTRLAPIAAVATLTLASAALGRAGGGGGPDAPGAPAQIPAGKEPGAGTPPVLIVPPPLIVTKAPDLEEGTAASRTPAAGKARRTLSDYILEPPYSRLGQVLDDLEGRPISGEWLIRPDNRISLGLYGEFHVAGLTVAEAKEKIVAQLEEYLDDELRGVEEIDPATEKKAAIVPRETDRVWVDASNSRGKFVYALGAFKKPSRIPIADSDTLRDMVAKAGGLADDAAKVWLVRANPGPDGPKTEAVDVGAITRRADDAKDFQLRPGDRLIAMSQTDVAPPSKPTASPEPAPADLPARLDRLEARLDLLLKRLGE